MRSWRTERKEYWRSLGYDEEGEQTVIWFSRVGRILDDDPDHVVTCPHDSLLFLRAPSGHEWNMSASLAEIKLNPTKWVFYKNCFQPHIRLCDRCRRNWNRIVEKKKSL